jgi:hypothetical protein
MGINQIILEYLRVILSWPLLTFILLIIFLFKFANSIKVFLENLRSLKAGPFEFSQQQKPPEEINKKIEDKLEESGITLTKEQLKQIEETFETLSKEKQNKEFQISKQGEVIRYLAERAELYEFLYLNLYLVYNSKIALFWFVNPSTKDNFIYSFPLPPQIVNQTAEKEAIFTVLLSNGLIEQDGLLFKISEKGKRFLKFLGYNVNF